MGGTRHIGPGLLILIVFHMFFDVCSIPQNIGSEWRPASVSAVNCSKPCINGRCTGFELCSCKTGYLLRKRYECIPLCRGGCPRGARCIAPGTCDCGPDYIFKSMPCGQTSRNSTNSVSYGDHGKCVCDSNWRELRSTGSCVGCVARCEPPCGNGSCIRPNTCECLPGYDTQPNGVKISERLCVPVCKNCEGSCIAPQKCVCEEPYEAKSVDANEDDCDCFDNCSGTQRICEKTICVIANSNAKGYWWIYLLGAILLLTAIGSALAFFRKRQVCNYNINDTKTGSNPADCVTMTQITDSSISEQL